MKAKSTVEFLKQRTTRTKLAIKEAEKEQNVPIRRNTYASRPKNASTLNLVSRIALLALSSLSPVKSQQLVPTKSKQKILMYKGDTKEIFFSKHFKFDTSSKFNYTVQPANHSDVMTFTIFGTVNTIFTEPHELFNQNQDCNKISTLGAERFIVFCKKNIVGTLIYSKMPKIYLNITVTGNKDGLICRRAISIYYRSLISMGAFSKVHMVLCKRDPKLKLNAKKEEVVVARFMILNNKFENVGKQEWYMSDFSNPNVDIHKMLFIYVAQNITGLMKELKFPGQMGMNCFYTRDVTQMVPVCKMLMVQKDKHTEKFFSKGRYQARYKLDPLKMRNTQILEITSLNNENRLGELDFIYYTHLPIQNKGKIFLQGVKLAYSKDGLIEFIQKEHPYKMTIIVNGDISKLKVINWKAKQITMIDDKKMIFIYYQPLKNSGSNVVSSIFYNVLCDGLDDQYKYYNFDIGKDYAFVSFQHKTNPQQFIYAVIDREGSYLQGLRCWNLSNADFIAFNREDQIRYYKDKNLTTNELSMGSMVISTTNKTTHYPFNVKVAQMSQRFQNNYMEIEVSVIQNPFGRFLIDLKFEAITVLHGGWTELQVGPGTFQGNDALVSLSGIEKNDFRVIETDTRVCEIKPAESSKVGPKSIMYKKTIMYIQFIEFNVLLASVRGAYGSYLCGRKPKAEIVDRRNCTCHEIGITMFYQKDFVVYAKNIDDNFIVIATARQLGVTDGLAWIVDPSFPGGYILRDSNTFMGMVGPTLPYHSLKRQKGEFLAYSSAKNIRLIYIQDVENGTDMIWSVVFTSFEQKISANKTQIFYKTIDNARLNIVGYDDRENVYDIHKLKRISGSSNSFMFSGMSKTQGPFVAYVRLIKSCPGGEEATCLTLEQTWHLNRFNLAKFNKFTFCPMNQDLILFNYPIRDKVGDITYDDPRRPDYGAIFAIPLKKRKPYASMKDIRLGYPFLELGVVKLIDVKCNGLLNSFEILVQVKLKEKDKDGKPKYKNRLISYQSHQNGDPRDRINIIIDDIEDGANSLATWGDATRSFVKVIAYFRQIGEKSKPSNITFVNFYNTIYNIPSQRRIQFRSSFLRKGFPLNMLLSTKSSDQDYSRARSQIIVKVSEPNDTPVIKINTSRSVNMNNLPDIKEDYYSINLEETNILNITNHYFRSYLIKRKDNKSRKYQRVISKDSKVWLDDKVALSEKILEGKNVIGFTQNNGWFMMILRSGKVIISKKNNKTGLDMKNHLEVANVNAKYVFLSTDYKKNMMYGFMLVDQEEGDKVKIIAFKPDTVSFKSKSGGVQLYDTTEQTTEFSYYKMTVYLCSTNTVFTIVMMSDDKDREGIITFRPNHHANLSPFNLSKAIFLEQNLEFLDQIKDYASICLKDPKTGNFILTQVLLHPISEKMTILKLDIASQKVNRNSSIDLLPNIPEVYPLSPVFIKTKAYLDGTVKEGELVTHCYISYSGIFDYVFKFHFNTDPSDTKVLIDFKIEKVIPKVKSFLTVYINTYSSYVVLVGLNLADSQESMINRRYHLLVFSMSRNSIVGSFPMSLQSLQKKNFLGLCSNVMVDEDKVSLFLLVVRTTNDYKLKNTISTIMVYSLQEMGIRIKRNYIKKGVYIHRRRRVLESKSSSKSTSSSSIPALPDKSIKKASDGNMESSSSSPDVSASQTPPGKYFDPELYRIVSYGFDNSTSQNISMKLLINYGPPIVTDQEKFLFHLFNNTLICGIGLFFLALCICIMAYRQKMIEDEIKQMKGGIQLRIEINEVTGIETETYVSKPRL